MNANDIQQLLSAIQEQPELAIALVVLLIIVLFLLRVVVMLVFRAIGWIAHYLFGAIPGAIVYFMNGDLKHLDNESLLHGIAVALVIGIISNVFGIKQDS